MRGDNDRAIRLHDLAFGGFLVLLAIRLAGTGSVHLLLVLGLLAAQAVVLATAGPRHRLIFYPFALQAGYFVLGPAMESIHVRRVDALLQHLDLELWGAHPSVLLEPLNHPVLTDIMSGCYLLFFPYLVVAHLDYFRRDLETLRRFCAGLYTVYAIGLIGYVLLPAAGPYVAMADQFRAPLTGGLLARIHHSIVVCGTNGVDVFPSLHCAVTSFLLFFDRRRAPKRFWILLVPVAGLWVSTIYLRYHYFVDVAAGFALAAVGLWVARKSPYPFDPEPSRR